MEDSGVDMESLLSRYAGRALATQVASLAASGDGSGDPAGLNYTTEPTTSAATCASQTAITPDELWSLFLSPKPSQRARGEWVAGTTTFSGIMRLKDGESRYMLQPALSQGEVDQLIGRPLREDANYQAMTASKCPITFGDHSAFWVRWARGMEFTRDDSFAFTSFETTFRFAVWFDCVLADATAIYHLLMAA
jgi:HK97 family phage major capsid protein